ncbi:MAG: PKD domain-containing protein [Dehalococcoidia bacterium]|nr:PKD domain-containing protein [Dehalococcoidia bacterium]
MNQGKARARLKGRSVLGWLATALVAAAIVTACTSAEDGSGAALPTEGGGVASTPAATPTVTITAPAVTAADQGLPVTLVARLDGPRAAVTVDFGDGTPVKAAEALDGASLAASHVYARAGEFRALLTAREGENVRATAATVVRVAPRRIVFVQGINSQSSCPEGRNFLDNAPAWVGRVLTGSEALTERLAVTASDFVFFSYAGTYCDGGDGTSGAAPSYRSGDTCASIEQDHAPRLRALIDALGPARVTIVAHSMGGVVAAYLAASDPLWASEHIASIATFDSPLGGVDLARDNLLAGYGFLANGCGSGSAAVGELRSGSRVVRLAEAAAVVVPFYTLDATAGERATLGLAQTVPGASTRLPGERLHWTADDGHSGIWSRPPEPDEATDRRAFIVCALLAAATCPP